MEAVHCCLHIFLVRRDNRKENAYDIFAIYPKPD